MFRTPFASIFTRYVDDILMIYNTEYTNPETIHQHINKTHPNLQFTPSQEHKKHITSSVYDCTVEDVENA